MAVLRQAIASSAVSDYPAYAVLLVPQMQPIPSFPYQSEDLSGRKGFTASASELIFLVWIRILPDPVNLFTSPSPVVKPKVPEATSML